MEVEIQPDHSTRELLKSLNNFSYEWRHNGTILSNQLVNDGLQVGGFNIENNRITIEPTSPKDAGIYSIVISSFGISNVTFASCAARALQFLKSYAIFQEVEFYAYTSKW